jgi:hypothetical protein
MKVARDFVKQHETKSQSQSGPLRSPRHKFHLNIPKRRPVTVTPPPPPPSITKKTSLVRLAKNRKHGCAGFENPVAEDLREAEDKASEPGQHATCQSCSGERMANSSSNSRYASIVGRRIPPGRQYLSESIFVWTALQITETWVSISHLCDPQTLTVCFPTIISA